MESDPNEPDTGQIIERTIQSLAEGISGMADSERGSLVRSAGRILRGMVGMKLLSALDEEWNHYREAGRIADDFVGTPQHRECLQEIFDFLDGDCPDEFRFEFIKRLFLAAATEKQSSRESVLPQQFMRIVKGLSSGELLVLATTFRLYKERGSKGMVAADAESAAVWLERVAENSGLGTVELVELHERVLIEKLLVTARRRGDLSGIFPANYRLSKLAIQLCEFVES